MLLQTCPECARQYDVAHLDPGAHVRCICEERFTVKPARDLRVQGLRCRHCGAPVGAEEEACGYCTAALDERDRTSARCPSCFERMDADAAHCSACGTRIDPQALPPIPAGATCPRCEGELQIRSLEVACVIECAGCDGLWLDPDVFRGLCRDARQEAVTLGARVGGEAPAVAPEKPSYIPCLDCGEIMHRRQFTHRARPTGVILDFCRDHGVWFDGNELSAVLASIRDGSATAPAPELIDEALAPRRFARTLPEGRGLEEPRPFRWTYRDVLHVLVELFVGPGVGGGRGWFFR